MAFLLDTNIAIWVGDEHRHVWNRIAALKGPQLLSVVTVIELEGGIAADPKRAVERRAALSAMLELFEVLPLNSSVVASYAAIIAQTGFSRSRILDRLIAATAIVHGLTVITSNGGDFQNIPGLKLEVWPRPAQ